MKSLLVVGILLTMNSACAALNKSADPASVSSQIADKTNRVEHAIVPLQDIEIQAERASLALTTDVTKRGKILSAHIKIQDDFKKLSSDVRHVAEVAAGTGTDPLPLSKLIQNLISEVQPIADEIEGQFGVNQATRTTIGAGVTVLSAAIAAIGS